MLEELVLVVHLMALPERGPKLKMNACPKTICKFKSKYYGITKMLLLQESPFITKTGMPQG